MSTVRNAVAKALFVATALSIGPLAMAQSWPTNPGNGPSDLFVAVWNDSTNVSYVQDLGTGWTSADLASTSEFLNPNGYSTSLTLDAGGLSAALGGGTLDFALFAGDTSVAGNNFNTYLGNSGYLSTVTGVGPKALSNSDVFGAGVGIASTYLTNNAPNQPAGNAFLTSVSTAEWNSPSNTADPHGNFNIGGLAGSASGTGTLELWEYVATSTNDGGNDPTTVSNVGNSAHNGVFSLNDATGVLSYSLAASTGSVPLPAAVWLLASGLLGLGAVSRRRSGTNAEAV